MKLFRLLTTTAITTMAVAAMAVSASAADEITANYSYDSTEQVGTVTLTGLPESATTQLTLLVLDQNAETVTEGMIKQIDQGTNSEIADVKVADLSALSSAEQTTLVEEYNALADADKTKEAYDKLVADYKESATYYVRVGGTQDADTKKYVILTDTFEVETTVALPDAPGTGGGEGGEEPEEPISQYLKGDIDQSEWIDMEDAIVMLSYDAGFEDYDSASDEIKYLGDVDGSEWIDMEDAVQVLLLDAGFDSDYIVQYE